MKDVVGTVQPFICNLNGPAGYVITLFQIVDDSPEDRLLTFAAGLHFHADRYLMDIKKQPHTNQRFGFILL